MLHAVWAGFAYLGGRTENRPENGSVIVTKILSWITAGPSGQLYLPS
jgi:hypothetical protein